jgi:putative cell wall-binding protein
MGLTVSSNPAASGTTVIYTGTLVPLEPVSTEFRFHIEDIAAGPGATCTPVDQCEIDGITPRWTLPSLTGPTTFTFTTGATPGATARLFVDSVGTDCIGACPPTVRLIRPTLTVGISYSGPPVVTTGSTLHVSVTGRTDAGPASVLFDIHLPAGLTAPTNVQPVGAAWIESSRDIEFAADIDEPVTVTFDTVVTAPNGTKIDLTADLRQSDGYGDGSSTLAVSVGSSIPPAPGVARLAGADRYATSAAISRATSPTSRPMMTFIATGLNFPDALAAGPAAYVLGGQVLLVGRDGIPAAVAGELARLRPSQIRVLGGSAVVSDAVLNALKAYSHNPVIRLAGMTRYDTAAKVADTAFEDYTGRVFIASGAGFPDALAGGAAAGAEAAPIVLSTATGLPAQSVVALGSMNPTGFVLLGGTGVLGPAVVAQLMSLRPDVPIERWAGADRYATSAEIARRAFPSGAETVYVANGGNFPDALSGGPSAMVSEAPVLLARRDCLPQSVYDRLQSLDPDRIVLLGGTGVLSPSVLTTICA